MPQAKLAFIYSKKKFAGKLTKFFTGSYCYHVGWVVEETSSFYDMNLLRQKRSWPRYSPESVIVRNIPCSVSEEYLEAQLKSDENTYGILDYLLFALRPIYHLFGKSTPNAGGTICSEMCYNDMVANGFPDVMREVPSPADLEVLVLGHKNAIEPIG